MPKIKDIVEIEKKKHELFCNAIDGFGITSKVCTCGIEKINQEQSDLGNKSIGLDEGKMEKTIFNELESFMCFHYGREFWHTKTRKIASALKQAENEIICEVKE